MNNRFYLCRYLHSSYTSLIRTTSIWLAACCTPHKIAVYLYRDGIAIFESNIVNQLTDCDFIAIIYN